MKRLWACFLGSGHQSVPPSGCMHGALAIERTSDGTRDLFSNNVFWGGSFNTVGPAVQDRIISQSEENTHGHIGSQDLGHRDRLFASLLD